MCQRFDRGETATEIMKAYRRLLENPAITRNMILGVLARGGRLGNGRATMRTRTSGKVKQGSLKVRARDGELFADPVKVAAGNSTFGRSGHGERKEGRPIPIRPVTATAKTIEALRHGECKFAVGQPAEGEEQLFCGGAALLNRPYCADHNGFAYEPEAKASGKPADPLRRRR